MRYSNENMLNNDVCVICIDIVILQRLAEIAHTLLKLAPYDSETMGCAGMQR
jgi:hypothetical protein